MPAIWIFMWRRLPVLAAPSPRHEVIGIKLGCDIFWCGMEMICKYNCLWREQNINTRHDQGMFIYHFVLRFKTTQWFLDVVVLMLVNFSCSCRLQWYWRPCGVYGWPRPCLLRVSKVADHLWSVAPPPPTALLLSSIFTKTKSSWRWFVIFRFLIFTLFSTIIM